MSIEEKKYMNSGIICDISDKSLSLCTQLVLKEMMARDIFSKYNCSQFKLEIIFKKPQTK